MITINDEKIALFSDSHFGVRKNNKVFLQRIISYFTEEAIPYLKEHNISTLIFLGDFFDNRDNQNVLVKNEVYSLFKHHLNDFRIIMLLGNHDIYYKNTLEVNSLKFISEFENVTIIDHITDIMIGNHKGLLVPWQVDDSILSRDCSGYDICCGHFEINSFYVNKTTKFEHGLSPTFFFNNFKVTFSGHFHLFEDRTIGNSKIVYVGTQYHLSRHDIETDKGFVVLDTETLEYERVLSKNTIKYITNVWPDKLTEEETRGNIIDVYVLISDVYDEADVNRYIEQLEKWKPLEINPFPKYNVNSSGGTVSSKNFKSMEVIVTDYIEQRLEISDAFKSMTNQYVMELIDRAKKDKL